MEMEMEMGVCGQLLKCHTPRSRVESSCNCVDVNRVCSSPVSSSMAFLVTLKIPPSKTHISISQLCFFLLSLIAYEHSGLFLV